MSEHPAPQTTSLSWMPIFVDDLLALAATLTPRQLGGLFRLRAYAWRQRPAATLPDSDARLATISGLGADWAEDGPAIRELLEPTEGGRLVDPWLQNMHREQMAKYLSASLRGSKGGRPKAGEKAGGKAPEKLGETSALNQLQIPLGSGLQSSSTQTSEESKAGEKPGFPERSVSPDLERRQQEWLTANPGKRLPLNFHLTPPSAPKPPEDPYRAADENANAAAAKQAVQDMDLATEYATEMAESLERYRQGHDREYRAHVEEAVRLLGYLNRQQLSPDQQARIEEVVMARVREEQGWPTLVRYAANRRRAVVVRSVART